MKKEKARQILTLLRKEYPDVRGTALTFRNPLELLVATILSAQCTDEKVNEVTETLFKEYETTEDYAEADLNELETIIRPAGFYHNKAKFIKASAAKLVEDFKSQVPKSIEELTKLKGVARKTANVVLSNAFGINEGVAVDTHVMRLAKRLGFTDAKDRDKIEKDLMNLFPKDQWFELTNILIAHGRDKCGARRPKCNTCPVNHLCPSAFSFS
jgi:endonuclease-3